MEQLTILDRELQNNGLLTIEEAIKVIESIMNAESVDFCNNVDAEDVGYFSDRVFDYADRAACVYPIDQKAFYFNHRDFCDDVAQEFCLLDTIDLNETSISDLVAKAGAWGEVEYIRQKIEEDIEEIKQLYCIKTMRDLGVVRVSRKNLDHLIYEVIQDSEDDIDQLANCYKYIIEMHEAQPDGDSVQEVISTPETLEKYLSDSIGDIKTVYNETLGVMYPSWEDFEGAEC